MDIQPSLDQLARELKRRGLPEEYAERYLGELREHITDLVEERKSTMSKDAPENASVNWDQIAARIGDPATLAEAASVEFKRRSYSGRHPIVMFLLAPMPLVVLAWAATFAISFGLLAGIAVVTPWLTADADFGKIVARWPTGVACVFAILLVLSATAPPAALTVLLCRLAKRSGRSWRWALAACLLVALVAGMFQVSLDPPSRPAGGDGALSLGFGLWYLPPLKQWLQFALPLTIGLALLWRQTHPRHNREDAAPVFVADRQVA